MFVNKCCYLIYQLCIIYVVGRSDNNVIGFITMVLSLIHAIMQCTRIVCSERVCSESVFIMNFVVFSIISEHVIFGTVMCLS